MAEQNLRTIKTRIINKHATAAVWDSTDFVPLQGEWIIYDKDNDYPYERAKIGDGSKTVSELPFVDETYVDRFVTKSGNSTINGNLNVDGTLTMNSEEVATEAFVNNRMAELIGLNDGEFLEETLDTIKEIHDVILENQPAIDAIKNTTYDLISDSDSETGEAYIKLVSSDSEEPASIIGITGEGRTTVTSDENGNLIIETPVIPTATTEKAGIMSADDKKNLDSLYEASIHIAEATEDGIIEETITPVVGITESLVFAAGKNVSLVPDTDNKAIVIEADVELPLSSGDGENSLQTSESVAVGTGSIALGLNNLAGCKYYYISSLIADIDLLSGAIQASISLTTDNNYNLDGIFPIEVTSTRYNFQLANSDDYIAVIPSIETTYTTGDILTITANNGLTLEIKVTENEGTVIKGTVLTQLDYSLLENPSILLGSYKCYCMDKPTEGAFYTGSYNLVGGTDSIAIYNNSFVYGQGVEDNEDNQTVVGQYNKSKSGANFIVGNGESDSDRNNSVVVFKDGSIEQGTSNEHYAANSIVLGQDSTAGTKYFNIIEAPVRIAAEKVTTWAEMEYIDIKKLRATIYAENGAASMTVPKGWQAKNIISDHTVFPDVIANTSDKTAGFFFGDAKQITIELSKIDGSDTYGYDCPVVITQDGYRDANGWYTIKLDSVKGFTDDHIGRYFSLALGDITNEEYHFDVYSAITAIDYENNIIKSAWYPGSEYWDKLNLKTGILWIPTKPYLGTTKWEGAGAYGDGAHGVGANSFAFGKGTIAAGMYSLASGYDSVAGYASFATGKEAVATGKYSFASGMDTKAYGMGAVASGIQTIARGVASSCEGSSNAAEGSYSHVGGINSKALSYGSFAHGNTVTTDAEYQATFGTYNAVNTNAAFIVGNGNAALGNSNAFEVNKNGNAFVKGNLYVGNTGSGQPYAKEVATVEGIDNTIGKRVDNIERIITASSVNFIEDNDVAYSKIVPKNVESYASLNRVGGASTYTVNGTEFTKTGKVTSVDILGENLLDYGQSRPIAYGDGFNSNSILCSADILADGTFQIYTLQSPTYVGVDDGLTSDSIEVSIPCDSSIVYPAGIYSVGQTISCGVYNFDILFVRLTLTTPSGEYISKISGSNNTINQSFKVSNISVIYQPTMSGFPSMGISNISIPLLLTRGNIAKENAIPYKIQSIKIPEEIVSRDDYGLGVYTHDSSKLYNNYIDFENRKYIKNCLKFELDGYQTLIYLNDSRFSANFATFNNTIKCSDPKIKVTINGSSADPDRGPYVSIVIDYFDGDIVYRPDLVDEYIESQRANGTPVTIFCGTELTETIDISDLIGLDDNYMSVEPGDMIIFTNDAHTAVASSIEYQQVVTTN